MHRKFEQGGHFVNPGSVGQPREGEPSAKWATVDVLSGDVAFHRSSYDQFEAMQELTAMGWDERAIKALNKTKSGTL
jgi:diadenosine tetraphosphatase ApaH/serine/threonine PP2A family protein phosphatase